MSLPFKVTKMKNKIIILSISIILIGCYKSIDISYTEIHSQSNNPLMGLWDGIINCPDCEDDKYRFTVAIDNINDNNTNGTLKITKIPEQHSYILFKIKVTTNNNLIDIKTVGVIEEITGISGTFWCKKNNYHLNFLSNQKMLTGKWVSSSNCSVFNRPNTIEIIKQ